MKTSYLSMDMFFNLLDEVKCSEARVVIYKMIDTIKAMRECAGDAEEYDTKERADGIDFAADCFQEALEDYLCAHSKQTSMIERPFKDPSRN